MSSPSALRRAAAAALAAAVALAGGAGAYAAASAPDTTITVSPRVLIAAPQPSPVDFPGVAKARAGEPLPRGYVAVARDVRITRGAEIAHAALRLSCPAGKTWRSGASDGDVTVTVLDRIVSKKRSVLVMAGISSRDTAVGETAAGSVYALCR